MKRQDVGRSPHPSSWTRTRSAFPVNTRLFSEVAPARRWNIAPLGLTLPNMRGANAERRSLMGARAGPRLASLKGNEQ